MDEKILHEVVTKIIGPIEPIGDSSIDTYRLQNLENTVSVVRKLLEDIIDVSKYKGASEHSVDVSGKCAYENLVEFSHVLIDSFNED